ncbi:unnamed protein product [Polarella glacialis]|uniref:RmlD-like substrate binding domain-containing protein n=1 Tax=Polarella glacialis TaxID=89957 RepID=A0A813JN23_POLGL|nr:unnamed protein product [Polarella glacialis]
MATRKCVVSVNACLAPCGQQAKADPLSAIDGGQWPQVDASEVQQEDVLIFSDSWGYCKEILAQAPPGRVGMANVQTKAASSYNEKEVTKLVGSQSWDLIIFAVGIDPPASNSVEDIHKQQDAVLKLYLCILKKLGDDMSRCKRLVVITVDIFAEEPEIHEECGVGLMTNSALFGMSNTARYEVQCPIQFIDTEWALRTENTKYLVAEIFRHSSLGLGLSSTVSERLASSPSSTSWASSLLPALRALHDDVSSILTYDIYYTYLNSELRGRRDGLCLIFQQAVLPVVAHWSAARASQQSQGEPPCAKLGALMIEGAFEYKPQGGRALLQPFEHLCIDDAFWLLGRPSSKLRASSLLPALRALHDDVSSILTYDIYYTYLNPELKGRRDVSQMMPVVKGFLIGGLVWFAVPFCMTTTTGLASRALTMHPELGPAYIFAAASGRAELSHLAGPCAVWPSAALLVTWCGPGLFEPRTMKVDLFDHAALDAQFADFQPDIVIHLAAERRPDKLEQDKEYATRINSDVARSVGELSKRHGAWLIYPSTNYVFDGKAAPYAEDAAPTPLSVYGESKLAGEVSVAQVHPEAAILRFPLLYGPVERLDETSVTTMLSAVKEVTSVKRGLQDGERIKDECNKHKRLVALVALVIVAVNALMYRVMSTAQVAGLARVHTGSASSRVLHRVLTDCSSARLPSGARDASRNAARGCAEHSRPWAVSWQEAVDGEGLWGKTTVNTGRRKADLASHQLASIV